MCLFRRANYKPECDKPRAVQIQKAVIGVRKMQPDVMNSLRTGSTLTRLACPLFDAFHFFWRGTGSRNLNGAGLSVTSPKAKTLAKTTRPRRERDESVRPEFCGTWERFSYAATLAADVIPRSTANEVYPGAVTDSVGGTSSTVHVRVSGSNTRTLFRTNAKVKGTLLCAT